jgi:hypothetical protein
MRTNENTAASQTGTAWTTRQVSFPRYDAQGRVYGAHRAPAGTRVYARTRTDGLVAVRIPGTLFAQDVHPSAVAFKVAR